MLCTDKSAMELRNIILVHEKDFSLYPQGLFATGFCILMEMYVPEQRALVGSLVNVVWGISMTTLAGVAYVFPNWRHMQLFMSLILLLALPFYK